MSKKLTNLCSLQWLEVHIQTNAIIGGILSIIHPEQYNIGIDMLRTLQAHPEQVHKAEHLPKIFGVWNAPFNVLTLMSNRLTPYHRDNGATSPWYDILVPLGHYSNGRIEIPGLGYRFRYDPGTVVGISGRIVRHGAVCLGDRVCLAYHNKTTVMDHLGMAKATWMNKSRYIG